MGVPRLFGAIASALANEPTIALEASLDELVTGYGNLSYIGDRKSLQGFVLERAKETNSRLVSLGSRELDAARIHDPSLTEYVKALRARSLSSDQFAKEWFGANWIKSSGIFPDFVLGLDDTRTFGNGALLELKDSKAATLASFNSTIPTRFKSLDEVNKLAGASLVSHATQIFDFPLSVRAEYSSELRSCFYLVRTHAGTYSNVRISLVEGSFFETLPKDKLLQAIWGQLLDRRGVRGAERDGLLEILGGLDQSDIAQSREIEGASIRPRFRLMAEVHPDGNINRYSEIGGRTVNLVIKRERDMNLKWLMTEFERDGVITNLEESDGQESLSLQLGTQVLRMRVVTINHRRNGGHLVLQMNLNP